ncbi:MAG: NUDIX domain-containing protein [Patescibacteria group bacterium]
MKPGFEYIGIATPFYCHDGKGNLLMHKRTTACRDEHERWDTGSGQLEHGLSLEENVLKEVLEEYGCKGEIEGSVPAHDIFREQHGQHTHWVVAPFFVRVNPDEVKNNEPHKMEEISWFTLDTLPQPLHSGFAYTFKKYTDHFRKHIKK